MNETTGSLPRTSGERRGYVRNAVFVHRVAPSGVRADSDHQGFGREYWVITPAKRRIDEDRSDGIRPHDG